MARRVYRDAAGRFRRKYRDEMNPLEIYAVDFLAPAMADLAVGIAESMSREPKVAAMFDLMQGDAPVFHPRIVAA